MYSRPAGFDEALKYSQEMLSRVTIFPSSGPSAVLEVEDGNVSVADEPIRRRATLRTKLFDLTQVPTQVGDLLSSTSEAYLERGLRLSDGTAVYLPIGRFGISDVKLDWDGEECQAVIDGYDRAKKVSDAKLTTDYVIASGTNIKTGLQDLLQARYNGIQYSLSWTTFVTTNTFNTTILNAGDDAWMFVRKTGLEILGADIFFDVEGLLAIRSVQAPTAEAVDWTYAEGTEATLLSMSKRINDEGGYNHYIVFGEHPDGTPVRGEAIDSDINSPTYYLGAYGDRVAPIIRSSNIKTVDQANAAALAALNKNLGAAEEIHFMAIPNPAHEIGDVVALEVEALKVDNVYIIDKFNIGLSTYVAMGASTRKRRV